MPAEARLPWVVFGDGLFAQLLYIRRGEEDREGMKLAVLKIRPTEELLDYMGIDIDTLDPQDQGIIVRYQENMVVPLNDDPHNGMVWILCDFKGRDTRMTHYYSNQLQMIDGQERTIKSLRLENAYLHQEISKTTSQMEKHTQELVRRISPIMKLRGNIDDMTNPNAQGQSGQEVEYQTR